MLSAVLENIVTEKKWFNKLIIFERNIIFVPKFGKIVKKKLSTTIIIVGFLEQQINNHIITKTSKQAYTVINCVSTIANRHSKTGMHMCQKNSTNKHVKMTRWHAEHSPECDFNTQESDFHMQECNFHTHSVTLTRTSVITTRTSFWHA
jgi:hypothetical protein